MYYIMLILKIYQSINFIHPLSVIVIQTNYDMGLNYVSTVLCTITTLDYMLLQKLKTFQLSFSFIVNCKDEAAAQFCYVSKTFLIGS